VVTISVGNHICWSARPPVLDLTQFHRHWSWPWYDLDFDLALVDGWRSGVVVSALASINEVNQRRARLVLRWVTVSGFNCRWQTFISVCDQPTRSTQPGHPFVGRRFEYQPKGGDVLRLGSKGRYGSCVGGKTVWPLVTRGPYLSALEIRSL